MKKKYGISFILDYILLIVAGGYYFSILIKYNNTITKDRNIVIPLLFFIGVIFIATLAGMTGKVFSDLILYGKDYNADIFEKDKNKNTDSINYNH